MPIPTEDPTSTMTIDEKITPQTLTAPETFDISIPVLPGHDMVINHLDGTQELGTGNEAVEIAAREAVKGSNVPLSEVKGQVAPETLHRSVPDPETNQPVVSETVEPEVTPEVEPEVVTPTAEPEVPEEPVTEPAPAEPTSADVANV